MLIILLILALILIWPAVAVSKLLFILIAFVLLFAFLGYGRRL